MTLLPDTDPMLHRPTTKVVDFSCAGELANTLLNGMKQYDAVGLAANQIGIDASACAVSLSCGDLVLFNPEIVFLGADIEGGLEGCLSYPELHLTVKRPKHCIVRFLDIDGKPQSLTLNDFDARVVQHEVDHLNGITFTSKVSKLQLNRAKKKSAKKRK